MLIVSNYLGEFNMLYKLMGPFHHKFKKAQYYLTILKVIFSLKCFHLINGLSLIDFLAIENPCLK